MLPREDAGLLADESFINYCLKRNEGDVLHWEQFLKEHPEEQGHIEEMKVLVQLTTENINNIELKNQLLLLKRQLAHLDNAAPVITKSFGQRFLGRWKVAAVIACVLTGTAAAFVFFSGSFLKQQPRAALTYATKLAEKKAFRLPDGTTVILNAGSHITIASDFDQKDRKVLLDGEAYFDVVHNTQKPFIVQTSRMDVKVLGTAFDVKAYSHDAVYETSLIRGSIELSLKKENKKILLVPNQKYLIREEGNDNRKEKTAIPEHVDLKHKMTSGLLPVTVSRKDTTIVEVSWTENKLVFVNEPFDEVIQKLERWYGITIEIVDPSLAKNTFTASFRNEGIENVLSALQFSKPFTFKKENDKIMIYK